MNALRDLKSGSIAWIGGDSEQNSFTALKVEIVMIVELDIV